MTEQRSRVWRDGRVVEDDVEAAELNTRIHDESCLVWVDLVDPSDDEIDRLARDLGLGATAIDDLRSPRERPKVTRHRDHLFFMAYATRLERDDSARRGDGLLRIERISGFVLPHALVTVRSGDGCFDMDDVLQRWEDNAELLKDGPGALLHGLLDAIVDGHFDTVSLLDDEIEELEDELFAARRTNHAFLRDVYGVRKDIVQIRRVVLPMREVVNAMLRHRDDSDTELSRWYDDLYDHVLRASEWTESLRDMISSVFETNLSMQDTRLNVVMRQLAAWAAIIAVPTAITGWFGQNVPYPGFQEPLGLWLSVALILSLSGLLYGLFRRQGWL